MEMEETSKSIKSFAEATNAHVADDWDMILCTSGKEGSGKSSLGIRLASAIDPENFDLAKDIIYSADVAEVEKRLTSSRSKVFILDEAVRFLYKLNWASAEQKYLNQLFSVSRKLNKIVILIIPRFFDLNEQFRNWRVKSWIFTPERGKGVMFRRMVGAFSSGDIWDQKKNQPDEANALRRDLDVYSTYEKLPNYVDEIHWKKLPHKVEKEYKRLAVEAIDKMTAGSTGLGIMEDVWKKRLSLLVIADLMEKHRNRKNICKTANIPYTSLNDLLPQDIREALRLLKNQKQKTIPPEHKYNLYESSDNSVKKVTSEGKLDKIKEKSSDKKNKEGLDGLSK